MLFRLRPTVVPWPTWLVDATKRVVVSISIDLGLKPTNVDQVVCCSDSDDPVI